MPTWVSFTSYVWRCIRRAQKNCIYNLTLAHGTNKYQCITKQLQINRIIRWTYQGMHNIIITKRPWQRGVLEDSEGIYTIGGDCYLEAILYTANQTNIYVNK